MTTKRALISVTEKAGLIELGEGLTELGWEIISTGRTSTALRDGGVEAVDVSSTTDFPEIMGGRVKTLHPKVHGGILAVRDNAEHEAAMAEHGIEPIDLVVVNLYPFAAKVAEGASFDDCIENIDIGGPTMIRAAAKNHAFVGVVVDPADYPAVLEELRQSGELSAETRLALARKAFAHTAAYDTAIDEWFNKVEDLKYGENPYMSPAALYKTDDSDPLAVHRFELVEGDERSLVGLTDVDCLLQVLAHLAAGHELNFGSVPYMAVGVKHGNACGAAVGDDPLAVIRQMVTGDKRALFGGVVMTNFEVNSAVAEALMHREEDDPLRLFDGVFAPSFAADGPDALKRRHGKCRMMVNPALAELTADSLDANPRIRQVRGGYLKQPNYTFVLNLGESEVYGNGPTEQRDIITAWAIGCVSNSNTITLVRDGQLIGNGVGQQDRVGAADLAIKRALDAGHSTEGAAAYSDSYFPFPDGVKVLADAGAKTIFASSGSRGDADVIAACKDRGVTLFMQPDTKVRGFAKH